MKVGIITYHFPYNCGAALQCLALQTTLKKLGHKACVINYRPWYHQNRYTPRRNYRAAARLAFRTSEGSFKHRLKEAYKEGKKTVSFNRDKAKVAGFRVSDEKFSRFVKKNLNQTRVYRTVEQMKKHPPKCDVIFSGSDQLWNTSLTNGLFDKAYFIDFAPKRTKRATYAVGANFNDDASTVSQLRKLVEGLDAISLRETKYMRTVQRVMKEGTLLHQDLDPTLLLNKEDYAQFEADKSCLVHQTPYILTYTMGDVSQGKVYSAARQLSEKLGIPAIDITGNPTRAAEIMGVKSVKAGPDEFLTYFSNASYIIANSFHGTAFAVIYRKQFMTIPHSSTGNRVTDLLDRLGLSDRWTDVTKTCLETITEPIDYDSMEKRLEELKADSIGYISSLCTDSKN